MWRSSCVLNKYIVSMVKPFLLNVVKNQDQLCMSSCECLLNLVGCLQMSVLICIQEIGFRTVHDGLLCLNAFLINSIGSYVKYTRMYVKKVGIIINRYYIALRAVKLRIE